MRSDGSKRQQYLIERAQDDPAALQALYNLYIGRLYGYVAAKVQNTSDAEDLVSDIFLQIVRGLSQFKNKHELSFEAWIFTIARNAITDFYRRRGRAIHETDLDTATDIEAANEELDQLLIRREDAALIRSLLDTLPERRREVLILRYFSGLRNIEIAQVLHLDERTVASHLTRGLRDLHAAYIEAMADVDEGSPHER